MGGAELGATTVTPAMREKLAARLRLRPDRTDRGQVLPQTQMALRLPSATVAQAAARAHALADALGEERLIVPVQVEKEPDDPGHRPLDPRGPLLEATPGPHGATTVAFTSVDELRRWDSQARPMTLPTSQVAAAALSEDGPGTVTVDPRSEFPVILPRAALLALAGGGSWLPAWEDEELVEELRDVARVSPGIVGVAIRPGVAGTVGTDRRATAPNSPADDSPLWDGTVAVDVFIDTALARRAAGGDEARAQGDLGRALRALASSARLRESAQRVELVPRPVAAA